MNIAVRYYSRGGNTKAIAEAIADAAGILPISVDRPEAKIGEPVDVLFIGGALYAYGLDKNLKRYLETLKKEDVKKAVIFSTTWISKHSIALMKKALAEAEIPVAEEAFYVKGKPSEAQLKDAAAFAAKYL